MVRTDCAHLKIRNIQENVKRKFIVNHPTIHYRMLSAYFF